MLDSGSATSQLLVSTSLSSLWPPTQATLIPVPSSHNQAVISTSSGPESRLPSEHASYSSLFSSKQTGNILFRLINQNRILEIVSLSTPTNPIRFAFPSAVLPSPALSVWQENELHIFAITDIGSLYRLTLPLYTQDSTLWSEHLGTNWCREYHIRHASDGLHGIVQAQGSHSLVVALHNGYLLRLDAEDIGSSLTNGV
jgi:nuclear pore complex protein Nup160